MFLTLIVFFLILSILIFVHEFGHFFVAKRAGIKVEEFGFGLPPRIWGKKVGETIYSINALPIGGFVRMYGEDLEVKESKDKNRQFIFKPKKVRAAVAIAGVLMNFILATIVFAFVYTQTGIPTQSDQVRVVGVVPGSPAQTAGFMENDVILQADGTEIAASQTFMETTKKFAGREMEVVVQRGNEEKTLTIIPRESPPSGEGPLGVAISTIEMKFYPFWQMPYLGAIEGIKESIGWATLIVGALSGMVYQLITSGSVPSDIAGPVGIYQITGQVAKVGFLPVLQFLGILSINLAVVNILPLPALDGGRLLFIGIEAVLRKRVKAEIEAYVHQIGMAFLLLLFLLITIADVRRIFGASDILERLKSLLPVI